MDACAVALSQPHIIRLVIEAALDTCYTIDERQKTRFFRLAVLSKRWARECRGFRSAELALHFDAAPDARVPLTQLSDAKDLELIFSLRGLYDAKRLARPLMHQSIMWIQKVFTTVEKQPDLNSLRISIQKNPEGLYPSEVLEVLLGRFPVVVKSLTTLHLETWVGSGSESSDGIEFAMHALSKLSPALQHLSLANSGIGFSTERSPPFALRSLSVVGDLDTSDWAMTAGNGLAWAGHSYNELIAPRRRFQPDLSKLAHLIVQDVSPAYCDQDHPTFPAVESLGFVRWIGNGDADFEDPSVEPFFRRFPALRVLRVGPIESSVTVDQIIAAVAHMPKSLQLDVMRGKCWSDEQEQRIEEACEQRDIGLSWFAPGMDWMAGLNDSEKTARFDKAIMQPMRCEEKVRQVWLDIFQRG